jgi:hypothetical protein
MQYNSGGWLDSIVGAVFGALRSFDSSISQVTEKHVDFLALAMHVSEAIPSIISAEKDEAARGRLIERVESGLWPLVEDKEFASLLSAELSKFDVSDEVRQKLLASPLVWTIVLACTNPGPGWSFGSNFSRSASSFPATRASRTCSSSQRRLGSASSTCTRPPSRWFCFTFRCTSCCR